MTTYRCDSETLTLTLSLTNLLSRSKSRWVFDILFTQQFTTDIVS